MVRIIGAYWLGGVCDWYELLVRTPNAK